MTQPRHPALSYLLRRPNRDGTGLVGGCDPDGELLDACTVAERADSAADAALGRARAMAGSDPRIKPELAVALAHVRTRESAVERAVLLPARTPEGLRAKAALLMTVIGLGLDHTMLAASLARDVAESPR